jgi:thioredoxin 1
MQEVSEKELLQKITQGVVLVDVFKLDCQPCTVAHNLLTDLEKDYPTVSFLSINSAQAPWLLKEFEILYAPTILLFRDGHLANKIVRAVRRPVLVRNIEASL